MEMSPILVTIIPSNFGVFVTDFGETFGYLMKLVSKGVVDIQVSKIFHEIQKVSRELEIFRKLKKNQHIIFFEINK